MSDPDQGCGSGSRRKQFDEKKRKKGREIAMVGRNCNLFKKLDKLGPAAWFFLLMSCYGFEYELSLIRVNVCLEICVKSGRKSVKPFV